jgi:RimJ/RimL family protein N-acetyltransferase
MILPVLAPPAVRIDDGVAGLRAFQQRDLAAFEAAALPGGNDGVWLILYDGDPRRSLAAHIGGWSAGEGRAGPSLAVVRAGDDMPAGVVYFTVRSKDSVEMAYGVAPAYRGQGLATRAARLAAG